MTAEIHVFNSQHYVAARNLWESTDGVGVSEADSQHSIEAFLQRNPGLSLVAVEGDKVVGTILVGHDGRRGLIHHLSVAPAFRRQGIGARLVRDGLAGLRDLGIQKCHLLVFSNNSRARSFWQAIGAEHRETLIIYSLPTQPES
ncbi:MAG: GNAT family N-acetyltransferase [Betaproteobacteria bacterium]|nr:GNAT family N-acetyltransferase [Betaproteobacteria bacterium]